VKSETLKYRPHIDGLRAVAVASVVCFHAYPGLLNGGFVGVDVFFVISGFLISSILYREFEASSASGPRILAGFYGRRLRRIFPGLIVVLLACLVMGYFLLLPGELSSLARQTAASAGFFQNFLLARGAGYFDGGSSTNPLLHLWSLGIEEQFYLVWPFIIWLLVRCRQRLLPAAVFLASCSFFWNEQKSAALAPAAFFLPQMRMWELLIGAVVAAIRPVVSRSTGADGGARRPDWVPGPLLDNFLSASGLLAIAAGIVLIKSNVGYPTTRALLPTLGTALVVLSSGEAWVNRHVLSRRPLVWVGVISYPLYLWHWPLLTFSLISSDHPGSGLTRTIIVATSVLLAWLTYKFVEKPVSRSRSPGGLAMLLAGSMAAVACLGLYVERAAGFPSRFPSLLKDIAAYHYDPAAHWREGTYFLMPDQDETKFKVDPAEVSVAKPTIFLWGDSHAAALYPGLKKVYGNAYNIVQRTAAGTPPLIEGSLHPGIGRQISHYVLAMIRRSRPEYVVLQARWEPSEMKDLEDTINALKAANVRHIVLVGPVPQWIISLPQQLNNYARRHPSEPVPTRMTQGENPAPIETDGLMAALATRLGVDYVSPCRILGSDQGFLVRTGDTPDSLTTLDYGHLTVKGSEYLVDHFPELK
jgi:peptidoglycan/LPS O-acetylase OafA/YrhL